MNSYDDNCKKFIIHKNQKLIVLTWSQSYWVEMITNQLPMELIPEKRNQYWIHKFTKALLRGSRMVFFKNLIKLNIFYTRARCILTLAQSTTTPILKQTKDPKPLKEGLGFLIRVLNQWEDFTEPCRVCYIGQLWLLLHSPPEGVPEDSSAKE